MDELKKLISDLSSKGVIIQRKTVYFGNKNEKIAVKTTFVQDGFKGAVIRSLAQGSHRGAGVIKSLA